MSLFVPILATILLPDMQVVLFLTISVVASIGSIVAIVLGVITIRATTKGAPGRLDGIFGILLAVVGLVFNVPLVVQAVALLGS